ncbi:MAG: hypothetical protein IPG63_17690 [Xanthomonadales bacterium]|nr:hypothetical protein [Xanthomonadales bacterium]
MWINELRVQLSNFGVDESRMPGQPELVPVAGADVECDARPFQFGDPVFERSARAQASPSSQFDTASAASQVEAMIAAMAAFAAGAEKRYSSRCRSAAAHPICPATLVA